MSELTNVVINGVITGTSKKQNGKFKQDTQTAYIRPLKEEDAKALINFGLRQYTSKQGEKFFIVKTPVNGVQVFCAGEKVDQIETTMDAPTFTTQLVKINILKGQSDMGNEFFRLGAINVSSAADITLAKVANPFE